MNLPSCRTTFPCASLACAALLFSLFLPLRAAVAQDASASKAPDRAHVEEVLKGLNRGHSVGQIAVSPDGQRLAWIEYAKDGAEIRLAPLDNLDKSERLTAAAKPEQHCHEGELIWQPDAKALAFFSDCAHLGEQTDLYRSRLDGHLPARLTELKGYAAAPAFSPDGTRIAFLYVEGATRPAGALAAMNLAGPQARAVLAKLTGLDVTPAGFPYLAYRQADVAGVPCRLMRIGFVGELGYEIHCLANEHATLRRTLLEAGEGLDAMEYGFNAVGSLRL